MWDNFDKRTFDTLTTMNLGQIQNDKFSLIIRQFSEDTSNKNFLEIGTWNGLGSTKQFAEGLENRTDDYIFYSLECNIDKAEYAKRLYLNNKKINILNEVIFNDVPPNFYEIFPQCKNSELYKKWNEIDILNMKQCKIFLDRPELPKIFDVILLDGGEFTTYFEFQILKNRCRYLMLDDINVDKCKLIVKEIEDNPDKWSVIEKNTDTRNGFIVCKNLVYND
jgi:hypothetical protein